MRPASRPVLRDFVLDLVPAIPEHELEAVLDHAQMSPGLSHAGAARAAWLSLSAYVRHVFTDYDALLAEGYDVESARFFVAGTMEDVLKGWGCRHPLDFADDKGEDEGDDFDTSSQSSRLPDAPQIRESRRKRVRRL